MQLEAVKKLCQSSAELNVKFEVLRQAMGEANASMIEP
jgi:hypothetical protein